MMKVTVDLHPHGNAKKKQTVCTIDIINDGTGTVEKGNYDYHILDGEYKELSSGWIGKFDRSKGILKLLQRILNKELS